VAALAVPLPTGGQHTGGPAYATVALVQGNVPRMGLDAFAQRGAVIRNHVAGTLRLADDIRAGRLAKPDIVLWPENATDIDPYADPSVQGVIGAAVAAVGAPTLVGAVILGPGPHHARNAGLVWLPGQVPTVGYVKRQLVPFGEYVPYRSELGSVIGRLRRVAYDLVPGHSAGLVTLGKVRLSDVICYEVAYDQLVRGDVRAGGRMIVVQTNNATYGATETRQQLAMGRLRAIEHGRAVAVVATSGISAVIAPNGHVVASSGVFTPALLEERVPLRDSMTLADRLAGWPELVLSVAGLLALLVAAAKIRGERRRGGDIGARRVASPLPARLR
jgi:apolipoprotein N-acyltransferase